MTQRKPPGTSWEIVDRCADPCCPGTGCLRQPAGGRQAAAGYRSGIRPDLVGEAARQREQISLLPPSLELLRKVERELATIEKLPDEATVRRRVAALNVEIAKVNATMVEGPPTRLGTLDVDQVVARWRRTRSATPQ